MLMQPLSLVSKVLSLLIKQERQHLTPLVEDNLVAQFNKYGFKGRNNGKWSISFTQGCGKGFEICSLCNKLGHTVEVYLKKYGLHPYLKKLIIAQVSNEEIDLSPPQQSSVYGMSQHTEASGFTP